MHWSVTLITVAALGAGAAEETQQFDSYTKAYQAANSQHRPMLVILKSARDDAQASALDQLKQRDVSRELLDDYVVAVIDTGTEHGQKVHELFGKPALPRTVVIDERQEKQVYRTSDRLRPATLTAVLQQYRHGVPKTITAERPAWNGAVNSIPSATGSCPNCRRF